MAYAGKDDWGVMRKPLICRPPVPRSAFRRARLPTVDRSCPCHRFRRGWTAPRTPWCRGQRSRLSTCTSSTSSSRAAKGRGSWSACGPGRHSERPRRGVLGIAGLLSRPRGRPGEHRRDLGEDRRIWQQQGPGDANPGDAQRAGHPALLGPPPRASSAAAERSADGQWPGAVTAERAQASGPARRANLRRRTGGADARVPGPAACPRGVGRDLVFEGTIAMGAVGTVTYRDGNTVYAFGHPLDDVGRRSLPLQDAYVYDVIDNPSAAPAEATNSPHPGTPSERSRATRQTP